MTSYADFQLMRIRANWSELNREDEIVLLCKQRCKLVYLNMIIKVIIVTVVLLNHLLLFTLIRYFHVNLKAFLTTFNATLGSPEVALLKGKR